MTKHAKKSSHLQAVDRTKTATVEIPLPLLGAFAGIERSYFDLCIRAGQQVLDALMEQDREELCGPRWKRDPARQAGRAGTTPSEVTLGGRRVRMTRPRVRSQAGQELELPSFIFAANRDPLDARALDAVACGISTRKYARSLEALPDDIEERGLPPLHRHDREAVDALADHTARGSPLPDRDDRWDHPGRPYGGDRPGHRCGGQEADSGPAGRSHREQPRGQSVAARPPRPRGGSRPGEAVRDRRSQGPVVRDPRGVRRVGRDPAVSDPQAPEHSGAPAGPHARERDVGVEGTRGTQEMRSSRSVDSSAWRPRSPPTIPVRRRPCARDSTDTLTLQRFGIDGVLYTKLRSTNAIENFNSGIATYSKHVKRWRDGTMVVRWVSAAIVEAEKKFRRVHGWRDIKKLVTALSALETRRRQPPSSSPRIKLQAAAHRRSTAGGTIPRPRPRQLPQGPSVCDKMAPAEGIANWTAGVLGLRSTRE